MGYYARAIDGLGLRIPKSKATEALTAVQAAVRERYGEDSALLPRDWEDLLDELSGDEREAEVLATAFDVRYLAANFDEAELGDVIFPPTFCGKWRNNSWYFSLLAPFFDSESWVVFMGEDGEFWKVSNEGEQSGTVTFHSVQAGV